MCFYLKRVCGNFQILVYTDPAGVSRTAAGSRFIFRINVNVRWDKHLHGATGAEHSKRFPSQRQEGNSFPVGLPVSLEPSPTDVGVGSTRGEHLESSLLLFFINRRVNGSRMD